MAGWFRHLGEEVAIDLPLTEEGLVLFYEGDAGQLEVAELSVEHALDQVQFEPGPGRDKGIGFLGVIDSQGSMFWAHGASSGWG